MSLKARIRRVGNAAAVIIPDALLETLNLYEGDPIFVKVTEQGITLSPQDPDLLDTYKDTQRYNPPHYNAYRPF